MDEILEQNLNIKSGDQVPSGTPSPATVKYVSSRAKQSEVERFLNAMRIKSLSKRDFSIHRYTSRSK